MKYFLVFPLCCLGVLMSAVTSAQAQSGIPYSRPMSAPMIENLSEPRTKSPAANHSIKIPRKSRQTQAAASYDDRTVAVEQGRKSRGVKSARKNRKNKDGNFSSNKRRPAHGGNTYQE